MSSEHETTELPPVDPTIIPLTASIHLSPLLPTDFPVMIRHLNDPAVYTNLIGPPNPYTAADADAFYRHVRTRLWTDPCDENAQPMRHHHTIRETKSGELVGAIEFGPYSKEFLNEEESDRDIWSVGYWLAPEWWGKGIMTAAVTKLVEEVMVKRMNKREFRVGVFEGNWGSRRVLERCGFSLKEVKKGMYVRDGVMINGWVLERVVDEVST